MFVVIAETEDLHADAVLYYLQKAGAPVVRFCPNRYIPEEMPLTCALQHDRTEAVLTVCGVPVRASEVRGVFCRDWEFLRCPADAPLAEHLALHENNAALAGFFHAMEQARWVNSPWLAARADNKFFQGIQARAAGLVVPETLVTSVPEALHTFYKKHKGNIIIKQMSDICLVDEEPFVDTQGRPDCHVYGFYTRRVTQDDLLHLEDLAASPCLFQEYIPKRSDLRITIVGPHCFAWRIDSQSVPAAEIDFRKVPDLQVERVSIPVQLEKALVRLVASWGLCFAACDVVEAQDGRYVFLEANVNGNWLWLEQGEESPIAECIAAFLMDKKPELMSPGKKAGVLI